METPTFTDHKTSDFNTESTETPNMTPKLRSLNSGPVILLLNDPPYTKEDLEEFSSFLSDPVTQDELIRELTTDDAKLKALITCSSQHAIGRKLLTGILQTNCMVLKEMVQFKVLYDANPKHRRTCLESIFDMINSTSSCSSVKKKLSKTFSVKSRRPRIAQSLPSLPSWGSRRKNNEETDQKSTNTPFGSDMGIVNEEEEDLPTFRDALSEDAMPDIKSKRYSGSSAWFYKKRNFNFDGDGSPSDSNSDSEEKFVRSVDSLELKREEDDWFESLQSMNFSPRLSSIAASRRLKLKSALSLPRPSCSSVDSAISHVPDTDYNAFMYEIPNTGILVALGDLASLDPSLQNIDLAERTISLLLQRAPNNLLNHLPRSYGSFERAGRDLVARKRTRPINLDVSTRLLMRRFFGDLPGRTLLIGEGMCNFAEMIMSWHHCHCNLTSLRLVISVWNTVIDQLRQRPGYSDIYHRLSKMTNVNFDEKQELKVYDPEDIPKTLLDSRTRISATESTTVSFGFDPCRLDEEFENVILNLLQVEVDLNETEQNRAHRKLVADFLHSVDNILAKDATISILLRLKTVQDPLSDAGLMSPYDSLDLEPLLEETGFVLCRLKTGFLVNDTSVPYNQSQSERAAVYVVRKASDNNTEISLDSSDDDEDTYISS